MSNLKLSKLQAFPIGVPDFSSIIEDNLFFVDKTEKLGALVSQYRRVFFSRPRRMGKTTLCSMLEELFTHGDSDKFGQGWSRQTPSHGVPCLIAGRCCFLVSTKL